MIVARVTKPKTPEITKMGISIDCWFNSIGYIFHAYSGCQMHLEKQLERYAITGVILVNKSDFTATCCIALYFGI